MVGGRSKEVAGVRFRQVTACHLHLLVGKVADVCIVDVGIIRRIKSHFLRIIGKLALKVDVPHMLEFFGGIISLCTLRVGVIGGNDTAIDKMAVYFIDNKN